MRHLRLSMFPKVNSGASPGFLMNRTSADLTFDLTFFFHIEKKLATNTVWGKLTCRKSWCLPFNSYPSSLPVSKSQATKSSCAESPSAGKFSDFKQKGEKKNEKKECICHNFPHLTDLALQSFGKGSSVVFSKLKVT